MSYSIYGVCVCVCVCVHVCANVCTLKPLLLIYMYMYAAIVSTKSA